MKSNVPLATHREEKNEIIKICFVKTSARPSSFSFISDARRCIYFAPFRPDEKNIDVAFVLKRSRHKYSLLFHITTVFHNNPWLALTDVHCAVHNDHATPHAVWSIHAGENSPVKNKQLLVPSSFYCYQKWSVCFEPETHTPGEMCNKSDNGIIL